MHGLRKKKKPPRKLLPSPVWMIQGLRQLPRPQMPMLAETPGAKHGEVCVMATLRLVPVSGPAIDEVKDPTVVGRDPSCEIVVTDGSVSRRHARLERRAGAWWVVDQGSANGTYVNSLKIAEQALKNNQELRFGAMAFEP